MSRNLSGTLQTEIEKSAVSLAYLFEVELHETTLRYTSWARDVSWNSQTWLANGYLIGNEAIQETTDISANGAVVSLAGTPPAMVSLALQSIRQNKPAKIYLIFLDASGAVVDTAIPLFIGKVDKCELIDGEDVSVIKIHCESKLIDLQKAPGLRYTHESQQGPFEGDDGFEYVEQLQVGYNGYWGKSKKVPKKKKSRRNRL